MSVYDAFISYSHAKDKPIAAALQSAVQKLGKPWYRRRALRLFRDDTSLSATPSLWPSIEQALGQSRYFILLASPEAAASKWVNKEVDHWLAHNSIETLLIGVTDGQLAWDENAGDFASHESTPLPPVLTGRFTSEPKWVDLRAYRDGADKHDAGFTEHAADFASAIHGTPKEDLLSQEVRQQRRALTLASSAVVLLSILGGVSTWQWRETNAAKRVAEENFVAAKETVDTVLLDLVQGLRDVDGLRVETARRILERAEAAIGKLEAHTHALEMRHSRVTMYGLFSETYGRLGDLGLAAEYARRGLHIARSLAASEPNNPLAQHRVTTALNNVAGVSKVTGDHGGQLSAHREALEILRELLKNPPVQVRRSLLEEGCPPQCLSSHVAWRTQMKVTLDGIGNSLRALGDIPGAVSAFQEGLGIARELAIEDPADLGRQSALSVSLNLLAHETMDQGAFQDALALNRESVDLLRSLTTSDQSNTAWQRQLAAGVHEMAESLWAVGDVADAIGFYRESLDIIRDLSTKDTANVVWQIEASQYLFRVGERLHARGDLDEALSLYREKLSIDRRFAAKASSDSKWQLGIAVTLNSIGDVLKAKKNPGRDFIAAYRESLEHMRTLAAAPSGKAGEIARGYIPLILDKIGDAQRDEGHQASSLVAYREALDIIRGLAAAEPRRRQYLYHLSTKVGNVLWSLGDFRGAQAAHRESLDIARALAADDPSNSEWQMGMVSALDHLSNVEASLAKYEDQLRPTMQNINGAAAIQNAARAGTASPYLSVQGTYIGTNTQSTVDMSAVGISMAGQMPVKDQISLSFQQSGEDVSYKTSLGGEGKGTGTIEGKNVVNAVLQSETKNCPGAYTVSLTFSGETVSWTYSGQDCGGRVAGYGAAKKMQH